MKWTTWENVGVDRMGCAWLIKRFIDPEAEFQFVSITAQPPIEDERAFDIPGAKLSHWRGHCSFYTILREYNLNNPVLDRIAAIIDEADTTSEAEITLEPTAAGLDLICRGLRRISPDDHTAIERGSLLYEALYAQLQSEGN